MTKNIRDARPRVKWVVLSGWVLCLVAFVVVAYRGKNVPPLEPWAQPRDDAGSPAKIDLRQLVYLLTPALTFAFTLVAHFVDRTWAAGGVAHRGDEIERLHDLQTDVVTGTMTKQSVLAALAAVFIAFVQQGRGDADAYQMLARTLATAGFSVSILLMLVSVKTYDYANRFNWEEHTKHGPSDPSDKCSYRVQLVSKAFRLDIVSFYFLLFTAILTTGLVEPWYPIAASALCGILLWVSYFFWAEPHPLGLASMRPAGLTLSVHNPAATAEWYKSKLGFAESGSANVLQKNGFSVELVQVEATAAQGVTQLSFRVNDADAAFKPLEGDAGVVSSVSTDAAAGVKQFSVRDGSGTLIRFFQKLPK